MIEVFNSIIQSESAMLSAIISALISGAISFTIYNFQTKNQQRLALYQKKYEFWLDFCKEYFSIEPFLRYMIKPTNRMLGIITTQNKDEIISIYSDWLTKWETFYKKVQGNECVYLVPQKIDVLALNAFFTALKENLEKLDIIENKNLSTNLTVISADSVAEVIRNAKVLFESSLELNSSSAMLYVKNLNKYIENDKDKNNKKYNYNEMLEIVNALSDNAYIDFLENNLNDTSNKLYKIVSTKSFNERCILLKDKIKNYFFKKEFYKIFKKKNKIRNKLGGINFDMEEEKCKYCLDKTKLFFKEFKSSIDDQGRYISIIGSVFYVSVLTIFCVTANQYSAPNKKHFIISFTISVGLFVINEIVGMVRTYRELKFKNKLWQDYNNQQITLKEYEYKDREYINKLYANAEKFWLIIFIPGVISGVWAVIALLFAVYKNF